MTLKCNVKRGICYTSKILTGIILCGIGVTIILLVGNAFAWVTIPEWAANVFVIVALVFWTIILLIFAYLVGDSAFDKLGIKFYKK